MHIFWSCYFSILEFFLKLFDTNWDFFFAVGRQFNIFDDLIVEVSNAFDWETCPYSFGDSIWAIASYPYWQCASITQIPILKVVNDCISCWKYGAGAFDAQYLSPPFLYFGNKSVFEPFSIDQTTNWLVVYLNMFNTWVLGQRVIPKDANSGDVFWLWISFLGYLTNCPIMIQPAQTRDVLFFDIGIMGENCSISIGWICNNNAFNIWFCNSQSLSLGLKNLFIEL